MAHNNGRIYIDTSVTPNVGINVRGDINPVLGTNCSGIGQACTSPQINKWARCKPFHYPQRLFANEAAREAARASVNYGLSASPLSPTSGTELLAWLSDSQNWNYAMPQAPYFRLQDFNGYEHNATAPLGQSQPIEFELSSQSGSEQSKDLFFAVNNWNANNYEFGLMDMQEIENYYLGYIFIKNNDNSSNPRYYIVTSAKRIKEIDLVNDVGYYATIYQEAPFDVAAEWTYYVVCCSHPILFDVASGSMAYFTASAAHLTHGGSLMYLPSFLPAPFMSREDSVGTLSVTSTAITLNVTLTIHATPTSQFMQIELDRSISESVQIKVTKIQMYANSNGAIYRRYNDLGTSAIVPIGDTIGTADLPNSSAAGWGNLYNADYRYMAYEYSLVHQLSPDINVVIHTPYTRIER